MSEHLKTARHWMTEADKGRMQSGVPTLDDLGKAVWRIILHLESQAAQTAESPEEVDWENFSVLEKRVAILEGLHLEDLYPAQSTSSSSPDTLPPEAIPGTWSISFQSWCHANPNGTLTLSPLPVTLASRNLIRDLGPWLGAEIGVTLTSKGGTPLRGWPSPSTEGPSPSPSGAPGTDAAATPSQAGREYPLWVGDYYQGDSDALREMTNEQEPHKSDANLICALHNEAVRQPSAEVKKKAALADKYATEIGQMDRRDRTRGQSEFLRQYDGIINEAVR